VTTLNSTQPLGSACADNIGMARRACLTVLGSVCVGLGAIGIVVPGMPTTVFLIVAAFLFARSSPSLHLRLSQHRVFGAYLRYADGRPMPRRAQMTALVAMWVGIAASTLLLGPAHPVVGIAIVAAGLAGTCTIVLMGNRQRSRLSKA